MIRAETKRRAEEYLSQRAAKKRPETRPANLPPLTPEIAEESGVGPYPIDEIIRLFSVSRATAYRWKKRNARVLPQSHVRNDGKVEHNLVRVGPSKPSRPYNPNLDAVKQALFSLRAARNKINERWPVTKECIDILDQLASEASQLAAEYDTENDTEDDDFEE